MRWLIDERITFLRQSMVLRGGLLINDLARHSQLNPRPRLRRTVEGEIAGDPGRLLTYSIKAKVDHSTAYME